MENLPTRVVSLTLSTALIWLSPGFGAIEAFAQVRSAVVATPASVPAIPIPAGGYSASVAPSVSVNVQLGSGLLTAPASLPITLLPAIQARGAAASAALSVSLSPVGERAGVREIAVSKQQLPSPYPLPNAGEGTTAAREVSRISAGVAGELRSAGPIADMEPARAATLGGRLQELLSSGRSAQVSDDPGLAPDARGFGMIAGMSQARGTGGYGGISLAKPAGWDSIHRAVQAAGDEPAAPLPPRIENGGGMGGGERGPLFARALASAMAIGPGAYFAFHLLAAGALIPGGLFAAAALGMAALPWLGASAPRALLGAPGLVIIALGGLTAAAMTGWGAAIGVAITLAGWGFARFARGNRTNPGAGEQMSAFFGAVSAIAAAGLLLTGVSGVAGTAALAVAGLFSLRLLAELPQWTYSGVAQVFRATFVGVEGVRRVFGSTRSDTVLYDRLARLTERQVKQFGWFSLVWLAGLWIPVFLSELLGTVVSLAGGIAVGVVEAPVMLGWGAFNELRGKHAIFDRLAMIFADSGRDAFGMLQGSKTTFFNSIERPLLALANSKNRAVSLLGGLLVKAAQYLWLAGIVVAAVPVLGGTLIHSLLRPSTAYDPSRHSPSAIRLAQDPLPGQKPVEHDDPIGPNREPFFPRLIGSAVALIPLYFLGLPFAVVGAPVAGWLYLAAGLGVASLPLMPQGAPGWLRRAPGAGLALAGLAALVTGTSPLVAIAAALSGWGLAMFSTKKAGEDHYYRVTDPEYVGAFFGALGTVVALGVGLAGGAGLIPLAFKVGGTLVSALTIYHLPGWFWKGGRTVLEGAGYSGSRVHRVMNFWSGDTQFRRNLNRWWDFWTSKKAGGWHWTWLWPAWAAYGLMELYDVALSAVSGLALGVLRAPLLFAWGAAYQINPASPATRFIGGFTRSLLDNSEGSKSLFDGWVARLIPHINVVAESGRPTVGAVASLVAARVLQLAWLARILVWSPVIAFRALRDGVKAVKEGMPPAGQPDKLNPNHL